jgi:hypothetical protein
MISPRWEPWAVPYIGAAVKALRASSKARIIILGKTIGFMMPLPTIVQHYGRRNGVDEYASKEEQPGLRSMNDQIRREAEAAGAEYIDKIKLLCGDGPCPVFVPPR